MDIPKSELHMHAETRARLDRLIARRTNGPAHDWEGWMNRLAAWPAGMPRLEQLFRASGLDKNDELDALNDDVNFAAWLTEAMEEAAADSTVLLEIGSGLSGVSGQASWPSSERSRSVFVHAIRPSAPRPLSQESGPRDPASPKCSRPAYALVRKGWLGSTSGPFPTIRRRIGQRRTVGPTGLPKSG